MLVKRLAVRKRYTYGIICVLDRGASVKQSSIGAPQHGGPRRHVRDGPFGHGDRSPQGVGLPSHPVETVRGLLEHVVLRLGIRVRSLELVLPSLQRGLLALSWTGPGDKSNTQDKNPTRSPKTSTRSVKYRTRGV